MSRSGNTKGANDALILGARRTAIGRFQGALMPISAPHLGAAAIRAALADSGVDPGQVDEVLMGQVVAAGSGQSPARRAALFAGLPESVGASSVNKACGSGLKAVMLGTQAIRLGDAGVIVAGGMENMSAAPYLVNVRQGARLGHQQMLDSVIHDGLWCSFEEWMMGSAAEFIADEYEVTREAMDGWALRSHERAIAATDAGRFKAEIVPVEVKDSKGRGAVVEADEAPRRDTSLEALLKLRPAFREGGRVTAGNAPGLNDGGAAVVLASRAKAEALGQTPMARVVGYAQAAVAPKAIFIAPALAIPKLLEKIGWTLADVDLVELNEAFAAQVLADGYALADKGWDWEKVNVNGGAIALGHPLGASGARALVTLLHALRDHGLKRGIASLCLGGGEAVALAVEVE